MDVVDKILEKIPHLEPYYTEWLEYLEDEEGNLPAHFNLGSKLGTLELSLKTCSRENKLTPADITISLGLLEDYVKNATPEEQGAVEVMFLEGMVWWAEDKESEGAQKYGDYFLSCLGPKCRELCKRNKEFWDKLNRERQKQIDEHYAQLQREYEERKKKGKVRH